MDSRPRKIYHEDEFDINQMFNTFYSRKADKFLLEEMVFTPMRLLHKTLGSGRIKGNTLIDFTVGPIIYHLLTICEFFEDITVLETNKSSINELEKWINMDPDALDWSHTSKFIAELEGNSDGWQRKEDILKQSIKQIIKCDFTKENPTDPVVLPKVDCLLAASALEVISKDQDQYSKNLKKISRWLKLGGHLILFGLLNTSFYTVGDHKFHVLTNNEDFLREVIRDAGYVIESLEVIESKLCSDAINHEHFIIITALKERES
ncbi:indolethylamine N-methyltransferase-like [Discoglossus pictus]